MKKISKNLRETAKLAQGLLKTFSKTKRKQALVVGLCGDLGTGKTTVTQELAKLLGIKEKVTSPTFVLMKIYKTNKGSFERLVHIDAYRLESEREMEKLGWQDLIKNPENLILVEWADKIKKILPQDTVFVCFSHLGENKRQIEIKNQKPW